MFNDKDTNAILSDQPRSVEPHPVLQAYYERASQRPLFVRELFNQTAAHYVRITGNADHVIGLDVSERMLDLARKRLAIPLIQGHAEELPIADESVDFLS